MIVKQQQATLASTVWQYLKHLNRQRNILFKPVRSWMMQGVMLMIAPRKSQFDPQQYQSILINFTGKGIGDVIVTSGLIALLRQHGKSVYVVGEKRILELFHDAIEVDGAFEFRKRMSKKDFQKLINNQDFDLVVDFADAGGDALCYIKLLRQVNYQHAIAFEQPKYHYFDSNLRLPIHQHVTGRMLAILDLLHIDVDVYRYAVNVPTECQHEFERFKQNHCQHHPQQKIIVFNPSGSCKNRSMSTSQVQQIIAKLKQRDEHVLIVLIDVGKQYGIENDRQIVVNPFSALLPYIKAIEAAQLVITVDTSIVHLASMTETPQIAVYNNRVIKGGLPNNTLWGPNSPHALQIFTQQHANTIPGDEIFNMDLKPLLEAMERML